MAMTASVPPESGWIVCAGSDFPHLFQLCFSKKGMDHAAQSRPISDLDGLVRVWPNTCGFWQDATGPLPVQKLSDSVVFFHTNPGSCCAKLAQIRFSSGWLSGFGQMHLVQKQASVQESSGPLLANASEPIQIRSGTFTGCISAAPQTNRQSTSKDVKDTRTFMRSRLSSTCFLALCMWSTLCFWADSFCCSSPTCRSISPTRCRSSVLVATSSPLRVDRLLFCFFSCQSNRTVQCWQSAVLLLLQLSEKIAQCSVSSAVRQNSILFWCFSCQRK